MNAVILPAGNDPMAEENKPPDDDGPPEKNKPADESPQESANGAAPAAEPAAQPPATDDNKKWYVVKVQSGREESIKDAIERRVKIEGLGDYFGQIIIPVERVTEMRNGKR